MSTGGFVEVADGWELPLAGSTVERCCFDYAVDLRLTSPGGPWQLRIEQSLVVTTPGGTEHLAVPEEGTGLGAVLGLLRREVVAAKAFSDGALSLTFDDGARLGAPPDEGYEAWELGGPRGARIVSLPGGDLAIWSPD